MDKFLPYEDYLGLTIQEKASLLFEKLSTLRVEELGMPYYCAEYFKGSHYKRLFFSIETSAHLLYRSISATKKPIQEMVIMDYGAGVGTLYTLAKMIGCRQVIYNDHLEDWKQSAQLIAEAIGVQVDEYIVGDIDETLAELKGKNIQCAIITSRNVVEHIYKLDHFYSAIATHQPGALVYSSTTANNKNPGSRIKHWFWHQKWEKQYKEQRKKMITEIAPGLSEAEVNNLTALTKGKAGKDIEESVLHYLTTKNFPIPIPVRSNTCDPLNGVWAEHLLKFEEYEKLIGAQNYTVRFGPGFWDTHYSKEWKNGLGKMLNKLIAINQSIAFMIAPFIYVIAESKKIKDLKK